MRVALLMTSGRTRLSTQLTTSVPHSSSPMPSKISPLTSSHAPIEPQANGVPKGIRAIAAVTAPRKIGASSPNHQ